MRFEHFIISAILVCVAALAVMMGIGSFSTEYGIDYSDNLENVSNISSKLFNVANETYDLTSAYQSSSGSDGWGDAISVAYQAFKMLGNSISAIKDLIDLSATIIGIPAFFVMALYSIIIIAAAWSVIYLWMRMQPR